MAAFAPNRRGVLSALGPVVLGAAGGTWLAACGLPASTSGGSGTGVPTTAARQDVTLTYQNWDNLTSVPTVGIWYRGVFDRLAERLPGARVEYVLTPFGEIVEKLIATVAAGTPPDVSVNSIVHGRELFEKGALLPLDDSLRKAPELAPAKYFDVANVYRRTQGQHFGLPLYTDSSLLAVNSRLLRDAGLDPKAADLRTWDDLVRYSERLTRRDGGKLTQLGFAFGRPGLPEFGTYVYGNGAELHDAEVTRATFNTAPNAQRVAEVLAYRAANFQRFGTNWADELQGDLFQLGKAAITYNSVAIQVRIRGGAYVPKDFEHWLVANPKGPSGSQPGVTTWVNMVVLPKGGKHPDLAFELARTAAGPEGQTRMFQVLSQYPSFKDFYQSKEFADGVRQDPVLDVVPRLHATGKAYPFFRRYNDASRDAGPLLADAVEGKLDHRQALLEAERKLNAVLAGP